MDKEKVKRLEELIQTNFKNGGHHVILTYNESPFEPSKDLEKFIRRLRNSEQDIKFIYTTEIGIRIHHHIIINKIDTGLIFTNWRGGVSVVTIENLIEAAHNLAKYLLKESSRYTASKNVVHSSCLRKDKFEEDEVHILLKEIKKELKDIRSILEPNELIFSVNIKTDYVTKDLNRTLKERGTGCHT